MTEAEFWTDLEYRVTRELAQQTDTRLRFLWCDGFVPDYVQPNDGFVVGFAFISEDDGRTFERYRFRLKLDPQVRQPHGVDWSAVLPESLTSRHWLLVNRDEKRIEIEPRNVSD